MDTTTQRLRTHTPDQSATFMFTQTVSAAAVAEEELMTPHLKLAMLPFVRKSWSPKLFSGIHAAFYAVWVSSSIVLHKSESSLKYTMPISNFLLSATPPFLVGTSCVSGTLRAPRIYFSLHFLQYHRFFLITLSQHLFSLFFSCLRICSSYEVASVLYNLGCVSY